MVIAIVWLVGFARQREDLLTAVSRLGCSDGSERSSAARQMHTEYAEVLQRSLSENLRNLRMIRPPYRAGLLFADLAQAAGSQYQLAGQPLRIVRRQKDGDWCNVPRLSDSAQRRLRNQRFL